jgi:hypothetical protein
LIVSLSAWLPAAARAQDEDKFPTPQDLPPPAEAPSPAPASPPRRQEFHVAYRLNVNYTGHIDRENIASLSMAASDAVHLALQDGPDDAWYWRLSKYGAAYAVDSAIRYVSHEYGHLSSFSKAGYHQALFGDKDKIQSSAPKASIGKMFLSGFNPFDNSAVSISQSDWDRILGDLGHDPTLVTRFTISVKAGGVNQEEVNLDRYADRLYDGELSYLDTMPFLVSSAAVLKYPVNIEMSDTGDYITELKATGLRTSAGQLHLLSGLTLLSGSTLAAFRGFILGLATRSGGVVEPFRLPIGEQVQVYAPELDNYLSIYGPTLKPSIPLKVYGVLLEPSYEQLFVSGASRGELGLSTRAPLWSFLRVGGSGYRNSDGGTWLEAGLEFLPLKWISLSLGYAWARDYTFHRDVFGASNDLLKKGEQSLLIGLSALHVF